MPACTRCMHCRPCCQMPVTHLHMLRQAQNVLCPCLNRHARCRERFLSKIGDLQPPPVVHILQVSCRLCGPLWTWPACTHCIAAICASTQDLSDQLAASRCCRASSRHHIVVLQSTADSDNVGNIICRKAEELAACTLVMAGKRISSFEQFMIGSVLRHCTIHSKMPVTIVQ